MVSRGSDGSKDTFMYDWTRGLAISSLVLLHTSFRVPLAWVTPHGLQI